MFFGGVGASSFTNNRRLLVIRCNSMRTEGDGSKEITEADFPNRESVVEYIKALNKEVYLQSELNGFKFSKQNKNK